MVFAALGVALKAEATQKVEEECGLIGIVVMNSVQSDFPDGGEDFSAFSYAMPD